MTKLQNLVQMAVVGAPHGIKGELRVKTFTADPLALGDYGPLFAEDGRAFTVAAIRPAKDVVVVRFKEVVDRTGAEVLTGTALYVDRSVLPEDLEEDEFYQTDLIGLEARDESGQRIGKVSAVRNFGGGDIVEIAISGRQTVMVPFTRVAIPTVSITEGFIQIDSIAAGLVEDEQDPEGDGKETDRPRGPKSAGGNR